VEFVVVTIYFTEEL